MCAKTIRNCIHKKILNLTEQDMIYKKIYKEKNKEKTHCDKVQAEKSIDFRPKEANDRSEYGHWKGDLVVGRDGKGAALLTFTERMTREKRNHVYKYIMHIHIDQENEEVMKMRID